MAAGALLQQLQEVHLMPRKTLFRGLGDREEVQGSGSGGFGAGTAGAKALELFLRLFSLHVASFYIILL